MARPRNDRPSQRLTVTLVADDAERLEVYAASIGRPPATAAARLLGTALQREDHDPCAEQLEAAQETIRHLESVVHKLEQRERVRAGTEASRPAWERGMGTLLADESLWSWLPELNALLGRHLESSPYLGTKTQVLDARGYADVLTALFPPLQDASGKCVTWSSIDYAHWARLDWDNREKRPSEARPVRAEVWEVAIRHVAKALALLASCSKPDTDPYLRIRADGEIRTEWLRTFAGIIGHDTNLLRETIPSRPLT